MIPLLFVVIERMPKIEGVQDAPLIGGRIASSYAATVNDSRTINNDLSICGGVNRNAAGMVKVLSFIRFIV